jgi:hypothetical protein
MERLGAGLHLMLYASSLTKVPTRFCMTTSSDGIKETVFVDCPYCLAVSQVRLSTDDFLLWKQYKRGVVTGFIQDLFPYLSASERELLKTGICDSCFPCD